MTMTYDAESRLKTAEYTDSGSVVHRTEYYYSGDSLLAEMKKYQNGALVSDSRYIRAGFLPIQERDSNNLIKREYTWGLDYGGGIGGLLNLKQGGVDYSYLYDGKGNVAALLDPSQNLAATYTYGPFGELMRTTGSLNQPYKFSTKEYDPETGLSYYGYRFYSASLGRWITRDPMGERGGMNLYGFVGGNPVNHIDPFGLFGTLDFGSHYYSGGGSPIDLAAVGLLPSFRSAGSVQIATDDFKHSIQETAETKARSLCGRCDKGEKSTNLSMNDKTVTDVTNEPDLFAVGHSTFFRSGQCSITVNCSTRTYFYYCSTNFSIRDWFKDPLNMGIEVGGTPYPINADWTEGVSGVGSF